MGQSKPILGRSARLAVDLRANLRRYHSRFTQERKCAIFILRLATCATGHTLKCKDMDTD
jgi:hypothetical protein